MSIILSRANIESKTWGSIFFTEKLQICINNRKLELDAVSDRINACFPDSSERTMIEIFKDNSSAKIEIALIDGENTIDIETSSVKCQMVLIHTKSVWKYLDEDIKEIGSYKGRSYSVNTKTYETTFGDSFLSSRHLEYPTYIPVYHNGSKYYADSFYKQVIMKHPKIMEAELIEKVKSMYLCKKPRIQHNMVKIKVERYNIVNSSMKSLMDKISFLRDGYLIVGFNGEIGEDYGAIRKEFIALVMEELSRDPRLANKNGIYDLAACTEEGEAPAIDFASPMDEIYKLLKGMGSDLKGLKDDDKSLKAARDGDERFYIYLGVIFGIVLKYQEVISVPFSFSFYENLLQRKFSVMHVHDPVFQRGMLKALRSFTKTTESIDYPYSFGELMNTLNYHLYASKQRGYDLVRLGCSAIIGTEFEFLTSFELPFLIYQYSPVTSDTLRPHIQYERCTLATKEINWLWEILSQKDAYFLNRFLQFATGSLCLNKRKDESTIWIEKTGIPSSLVTASTCSRRIYIGDYNNKNEMEYYLEYSIYNSEGFHKI